MDKARELREMLNSTLEELQYMASRMNRLINEVSEDLTEMDRHRRMQIQHCVIETKGQPIKLEGEGGPDD